ncbi:hypothetical protein C8R42DRAFT_291873 [Lentinula raphanica]|nr:hypothetical protein C8R42DRAFT_291873 [Lentinula raphanica]
MHITVGHILLCLVAVVQAAENSLSILPIRTSSSQSTRHASHYQHKVQTGRVDKLKGNQASSNSIAEALRHIDYICALFVMGDDSDTEMERADHEEHPSPECLPAHHELGPQNPSEGRPFEITFEITKILDRFRKERLGHRLRPFQIIYRNELDLVYQLEENMHDVYFWGGGMTHYCTRKSTKCLLSYIDADDYDSSFVATIRIKGGGAELARKPSERDDDDFVWAVPRNIRTDVLEHFARYRIVEGGAGST